MKVGDLVTLSAYATNLSAMRRWGPFYTRVKGIPRPVGIITEIIKSPYAPYEAASESYYYSVKWVKDKGPRGRGNWGLDKDRFVRRDLKFAY